MFYLSQLLNTAIEDNNNARVGKLIDILAPIVRAGGTTYPSVLLIEGGQERPWRVPLSAIERHDNILHLHVPVEQLMLQPETGDRQEISLAHEVLDKQVIDIVRKKTVRVNDISIGDDWEILGIDDSALGLIRRLAPSWLLGTRSQHTPTTLIPWTHIELVGLQQSEQQGTPAQRRNSGQLADLHPADIADIVHQLTPGQGARIIEGLDDETAADTMEEIDPDRRSTLRNFCA